MHFAITIMCKRCGSTFFNTVDMKTWERECKGCKKTWKAEEEWENSIIQASFDSKEQYDRLHKDYMWTVNSQGKYKFQPFETDLGAPLLEEGIKELEELEEEEECRYEAIERARRLAKAELSFDKTVEEVKKKKWPDFIPARHYHNYPGYEGTVVVSTPYWGGRSTRHIKIGPNERLCPKCNGEGQVRIRCGGTHGPEDYVRCTCDGGKVTK